MSESSAAIADRRAEPLEVASSANRWLVLGVVGLAQLMVVLDATIVNIALPSAQKALGFSTADRQWVVTAYTLGFGGLLLVGGRLSDLIGRRRMLLIGLVGFAGASALGGASTGFAMLVIARAIQGAFGAALAPAALATLTVTFTDPAERGKAFGVYGAIAGAGGAVGLLLGGLLTQYLNWRWCLYVNLLLAVVAIIGTLRFVTRQGRNPNVRVDVPGTALAVGGLIALVYGLSEADTAGWGAITTIVLLCLGGVLLVAFAVFEQRSPHPLLPPRIVKNRYRGGSYLAIGLSGVGVFGVFLFLTYYLQLNLGFSPVKSGLAFLPLVATLMAGSTLSSAFLIQRVGPRVLISLGMLVGAAGIALLTQLTVHSTYASDVLPSLLVIGLGLGTIFGASFNAATYGADPQDAGVASAMVNTSQQIGASIGTALLNTFAGSAAASYLVAHGRTVANIAAASVHGDVVAFEIVVGIFVGGAVLSGLVLGPRIPSPTATAVAPAAA